ncbi:MAG: MFS transporter [Candidatus Rehaiarchaeum fermentans]|nr:MFS transporter [Candidatus Rehaiarchaeum fermentans]
MNNKNLILLFLVIANLMTSVDSTIVLLAFPAITAALHSNLSTIIWVILIYLLASAVSSTQFGRIGDLYGKSKIFKLGIVVFTVFSFLCGIAPTDISLIVFRLFQGLGGAMMISNSGAIIADTFDRNELGKAYGYNSLGWNIGAMLGIVLGGIITTFLGYRYIFFINVPIGILIFLGSQKYIIDLKRRKEKLDLIGMALLASFLILIFYSGINVASVGLTELNLFILILGILLIFPFYIREKSFSSPVINFSQFKAKIFRNSILAALFQGLGFMGVSFLLIMYLQGVRGFSPFLASLLLLPGYLIGSAFAPYAGKLSDLYGARILATLGLCAMIIGISIYFLIGSNSPIYLILIGSSITGFGSAMFWPANNSAVMENSLEGRFGASAGLLRLFNNIGIMGSFIIAIVSSSLVIPRALAFEVFVGTSKLIGGIKNGFITGFHFSLIFLISMLVISAILSLTRGKSNYLKHQR